MRVVMATIGAYPHLGGKSSHMELLVRGLGQLGVDVEVLSANCLGLIPRFVVSDGPRVALDFADKGLGLYWCYKWRAKLLTRHLRAMHLNNEEDIIHCHDTPAVLAATGMAGTGSGRPSIVLTVHGDVTNECISEGKVKLGGKSVLSLEQQEAEGYSKADCVITVDTRLHHHVARMSGRCDSLVMPNFVDTEMFGGDMRTTTTLFGNTRARDRVAISVNKAIGKEASETISDTAENCRYVFCPRRLVPKNGIDVAIRALAEILRNGNVDFTIVLVLGGDGPERTRLEQLSDELQVRQNVAFLGGIPGRDMPWYYQGCDLVLIPSVPSTGVIEATSISALEAMSSAKPVICSNLGGLAELISHDETGILVEPGSYRLLADAIVTVLRDDSLANRLGISARESVVDGHSHIQAARKLVQVYQELTSRHKPGR